MEYYDSRYVAHVLPESNNRNVFYQSEGKAFILYQVHNRIGEEDE